MKRPYVILNSAMSLDGRIGGKDERIRFSNELDKKRVHRLRAGVDAVMVGINTVVSDDPHLTVKYAEGKNPVRIVVDSGARIPASARVLDGMAKTIVAVSEKACENERDKIRNLSEKAEFVVLKCCGDNKVDLRGLLEVLHEKGIKKLLLEGGGALNRSMLEAGLVDEVFITVAPVFIGDGVNLVSGSLDNRINLKFKDLLVLEDRIVLHYLIPTHF